MGAAKNQPTLENNINITVDGYAIYSPLLCSLLQLFVPCQHLYQHFEPYLFWNLNYTIIEKMKTQISLPNNELRIY